MTLYDEMCDQIDQWIFAVNDEMDALAAQAPTEMVKDFAKEWWNWYSIEEKLTKLRAHLHRQWELRS